MATSRANSLVGLCHNFTKSLVLSRSHNVLHLSRHCCSTATNRRQTGFLSTNQVVVIPHRNKSWLNNLTADRLWKSMTALTGKAQTKARGKKPQKRYGKDLNKGRVIGEGKAGIDWTGLNRMGAIEDDLVASPQQKDPESEKNLANMRDQGSRRKRFKLLPEEKGWTAAGWGGRNLGPPDPIPGENFKGFTSRVMFVKKVYNMTASVGRKGSTAAMVVVGNGNGAIGYASGKAPNPMAALRKAKNRAATRLQYIERYDNHTLCHDIEYRFISTRVRMKKVFRGHGLKAHRVIRDICLLAGITDVFAKVRGSSNPLNLVQATIKGLASQEPFDHIAKRTGMHVVEFNPQTGPLPIVLASPDKDKMRDDVDEIDWDKDIPLETKEIKKLEIRKTKKHRPNPFNRPGRLVANELSASQNRKQEVYTSRRVVIR